MVLALLGILVLRQYLGDRYFRAAMMCVEQASIRAQTPGETPEVEQGAVRGEAPGQKPYETVADPDPDPLAEHECGELFAHAGRWTPSRAELHYEWAKHYERMMYQAAERDGTWEWLDGRWIFEDGARSRMLEARAVEHYHRAIDLSPAAHHVHGDLARLIRVKLYVGERTPEALLELKGPVPAPVSAAAAWRAFTLATRLAPYRSYDHRAFADWLVEHLLAVPLTGTDRQLAFTTAITHYRRALELQPRLLESVLESLARLTVAYDELVAVLPDGLPGLSALMLFLHDQPAWADNRDRFLAHWGRLAGVGGAAGTAAPAAELEVFHVAQAALLERENRSQEALRTLTAYLALAPDAVAARRRAAALALRQQDYPEAAHHARRALAQYPENRSSLNTLIAALEGMTCSRHTDVEQELQGLLAAYPDEARIYAALGDHWLEAGRVEQAERIYHRMITQTGDRARGYFLLGQLYEQTGRPAAAREQFKRAALLDRRYRQYFNRTLPFVQLVEAYFTATRDYRRLQDLLPRSPENLSRLVLFLHRHQAWAPNRAAFMADLESVRQEFAQIAGTPEEERTLRPWLTAYHFTLADIHLREGESGAALSVVRDLIAWDPANGAAQARLAQMLLAAGESPAAALPHLEQAMRLEPDEPRHVRDYAMALAGAGQVDDAEALARKLVQQRPKDPECRALLARIYEQAGKRQHAIDQLSQAVNLSREPEPYERELVRLLIDARRE